MQESTISAASTKSSCSHLSHCSSVAVSPSFTPFVWPWQIHRHERLAGALAVARAEARPGVAHRDDDLRGDAMATMNAITRIKAELPGVHTALGVSMDFYPSDVESIVEEGSIFIFRRNWAQFGVLGNVGVEYRTDKSGIFYLGATFHRPFNDMALADLTWTYLGPPTVRRFAVRTPLSGSYLTVDLRYYFHEDPERRVKRHGK